MGQLSSLSTSEPQIMKMQRQREGSDGEFLCFDIVNWTDYYYRLHCSIQGTGISSEGQTDFNRKFILFMGFFPL